MPLTEVEQEIECPFCGETISVLLDLSAGDQSYVEDCEVCCRPMQITYTIDTSDEVDLQVHSAS